LEATTGFEPVNQTWIVDVGGGVGRLIDIDSPGAKHRLLVRLEAPGDVEAFEMHDLGYDDLQTAVNKIRARFTEKDDHVWDFPGGVMWVPGMVR
jgi:hypothetical protein